MLPNGLNCCAYSILSQGVTVIITAGRIIASFSRFASLLR